LDALAVARNDPQIPIRLPRDAKDWIKAEAVKNGSSQNSEIIRAVRERMAREASNRKATA
jgi:hypothetical protein